MSSVQDIQDEFNQYYHQLLDPKTAIQGKQNIQSLIPKIHQTNQQLLEEIHVSNNELRELAIEIQKYKKIDVEQDKRILHAKTGEVTSDEQWELIQDVRSDYYQRNMEMVFGFVFIYLGYRVLAK